MARVQNPIIGQAVNTAGGMIFSNWKTLKVMRSKPLAVANPKTPAQQANRRRMALLASRMRELLQTIRLGFIRYQQGTTQWAQFIKANYALGTSDNGTDASLVTSKLRFAQGSLLQVGNFQIDQIVGQDIDLRWDDNSGQPGANATDRLNVVFVNADGSEVASLQSAETRTDEQATVTAPADIVAATALVYGFFSNVAGDDVSDSQIATP